MSENQNFGKTALGQSEILVSQTLYISFDVIAAGVNDRVAAVKCLTCNHHGALFT